MGNALEWEGKVDIWFLTTGRCREEKSGTVKA
jgi:hypothetical protein